MIIQPTDCWGKARLDPRSGVLLAWHPLPEHCLDVAMTFRALIALPIIRRRLEAAAGRPLTKSDLDRLAVFAMLHDLGKSNRGFQEKILRPDAPRVGHIREVAPLFFEADLSEQLAAAMGVNTLISWFADPDEGEALLIAALSHHGTPLRFDSSDRTGPYHAAKTQWWRPKNGRDPFQGIAALWTMAQQAFPSAFVTRGMPLSAPPALQHRFAGLVMLADWLGSHEGFFPFAQAPGDRLTFAPGAADRALQAVGLDARPYRTALGGQVPAFATVFGFKPRPLQEILATWPVIGDDRLLILEAETGSGKTEAALARFLTLFAAGEVDGLYFALPTRVAARELYGRVLRMVKTAFPDPSVRPPVLLAVPGYAQVDGVDAKTLLPGPETRWEDDATHAQQERAWAAERPKRFLAATVAVGTLDQALLSVLQVPHAHLRSVCLDRQLLVVDEVHASDPYMRQLLTQLLAHHLSIGGHALLLSATLGATACAGFVRASAIPAPPPDWVTAQEMPYPALTVAGQPPQAIPVATTDKTVQIECVSALADPVTLLLRIQTAVATGARVLVVLNTVARVMALQAASETALSPEILFQCQRAIAPHHGRFAAVDRTVLDAAVSARFGQGSAPGPVVLIGTQTLEQSLDLDADLLITDLCPMDVLLQRIGRLHRHNRVRPAGFETARCVVLIPEDATLESLLRPDGQVRGVAGLGNVYADLRVVRLTLDLMQSAPTWAIPRDNRRLVEGAMHPEALAMLDNPVWQRHGQKVEGEALALALQATLVGIQPKPFGQFTFNPLNAHLQTRLGLKDWRVRLERAVTSPFGQRLIEIVIPGYLAPATPEETATVLNEHPDELIFQCGERRYRYTRLGLQGEDGE
ncbi:MAG: CRISPR-associated helicase Cas3' [Candidatus Competibacteraceae bacterium]|nr:CRISPR-associated helicase Cas3' [Candidatus Competibacteraceae bacterium]MCP5125395.1 CRISPR-associated helicase Cas3' [Gammaproteobacteria bacterium]HRX71531.1 CRISPR-associated helicase Cas3' [Candidatus Competibacteraceae bacterium]